MNNYLPLLVQAKEEDLSDVLRDFKKFTSGAIVRVMKITSRRGRRDWMPGCLKRKMMLVNPPTNSASLYQLLLLS
jgi:hypothetical protein